MWPRPSRPSPRGRCSTAPSRYAGATLRLFGVPESEIAKSLLEIEA